MLSFQLLSSQTPELFKNGMDAGARYSSQQAFCQMNDVIQSQKLNPVPSPTSHKQPRDLLRVEFQGIITNQTSLDTQTLFTFFPFNTGHFSPLCFG